MIIVEVTQADIDAGIKNDCGRCPIALALSRVLEELNLSHVEYNVFINRINLYLYSEDRVLEQWNIISLPKKARRFVEAFDSGKAVFPISFAIVDWSSLVTEIFNDDTYGFFNRITF